MPLYVYQVVGEEDEVFEVLQGMSEPPLTHHPETGKPVVRILAAPNTMRKAAPGNLSNSRLEKLGFTKYERAGGGKYQKTAGTGPDLISGD
jgi:predicted nucleic acid-binding Zn ribbon protein